jgi:hypothetical protein
MKRLKGLDFVDDRLTVRYSASKEEQDLTIRVDLDAPRQNYPGMRARSFKSDVEHGFAGSDVFPPQDGQVTIVAPLADPAPSTSLEFSFRVRAIAPVFLRRVVEKFRLLVGFPPTVVRAMSIEGSRPLDRTKLSVDERKLKAWLSAPGAPYGAWPEVPFPVERKSAPRGASWTLEFEGRLNAQHRDELTVTAIGLTDCSGYDAIGEPVREDRIPELVFAKREVTASYDRFPWDREMLFGFMTNTFVSFHHRTMRIVRAEVSL